VTETDAARGVQDGADGGAAAARIRQLTMRACRRGTREMDLILGPYAQASLAGQGPDELALFEVLLDENDHDLYAWIAGRIGPARADAEPGPERLRPLLDRIAAFAAAQGPVVRGA